MKNHLNYFYYIYKSNKCKWKNKKLSINNPISVSTLIFFLIKLYVAPQ